jgi:hypothetical protein
MTNSFRPICAAVALLLCGCGCSLQGVPTQQHPSCSWVSQPPDNADELCTEVFRTFKTVVQAEVRGDDRTIRRLVRDPATAQRIIASGAALRAETILDLHVSPSLALEALTPGALAANLYLIGTTKRANHSDEETVYLQLRNGAAIVTHDVPGEEW